MTNSFGKIMAGATHELTKELLYFFPATRPRKIFFDHLPKCGVATLIAHLQQHYPRRKTFSMKDLAPELSVDEFKNMPRRKRHGYDLIKGHLAHELIDYVHPECLKVTVFREPVDRIVSHYYFVKSRPKHPLYWKIHKFRMSLEDYAVPGIRNDVRNWYTIHFSGLSLAEAEQNPEKAVARAVQVVLNRYDIIGFLDNFNLFIETLRHQAKLRYEYRNHKVNITRGRPNLRDIEPSTIHKIEQINHLDMAVYKKIKESLAS